MSAVTMENLIIPDWPAPSTVRAAITTRAGGASRDSFKSNNLALHVGDAPETVKANRQNLCRVLGLDKAPQWLEQVHGTKVVEACDDGLVRTADGCISAQRGVACAVMTADCLPILLCNRQGTQVAAVHAGWRSLAAGIVRAAVAKFDDQPSEILVYLGPAIGQAHFEVGIDVLEAFFANALSANHCEAITSAFIPSARPMKYQADLYRLARAELSALGLAGVYGGDFCTFDDARRFYSFRRDGVTGRMASLIWLT